MGAHGGIIAPAFWLALATGGGGGGGGIITFFVYRKPSSQHPEPFFAAPNGPRSLLDLKQVVSSAFLRDKAAA